MHQPNDQSPGMPAPDGASWSRLGRVRSFTKRVFDLTAVIAALPIVLPIALAVAIAIKCTSKGAALYWSDRIGADEQIFSMPKFRSMKIDAPVVATHLLPDPSALLTPIGGFLRRTSLDEIPQLWSVLTGDMSLVGPRPALFNQDDLIALRRERGVTALKPGVTGLAQVNGRDDLSIEDKVRWDAAYLADHGFVSDLRILAKTVVRVTRSEGVSH